MKKSGWKGCGIILLIFSIIFVLCGVEKLFFFNAEWNRIVGGDAYNYIFAMTRAAAYFGLAIFFAILSVACGLFYTLANLPEPKSEPKPESKPKPVNNSNFTSRTNISQEPTGNFWVCPKCGNPNPNGVRICQHCGQ